MQSVLTQDHIAFYATYIILIFHAEFYDSLSFQCRHHLNRNTRNEHAGVKESGRMNDIRHKMPKWHITWFFTLSY